jgi:hypothetical protein
VQVDNAMLSMLGSFDFQKLLELQKLEDEKAVLPEAQQQVSVDTAMPVVQQSQTAQAAGGEEDSSIMDIAQLAFAFL